MKSTSLLWRKCIIAKVCPLTSLGTLFEDQFLAGRLALRGRLGCGTTVDDTFDLKISQTYSITNECETKHTAVADIAKAPYS
jgi:hypothetical protein